MQQIQPTRRGIQDDTLATLLLPFTATTSASSTDARSTTEVRATSLQLLSTPDYSCCICCSPKRHAHPLFKELFAILVARSVISCSSSCTVSALFLKEAFFQFSFQLNCFSLYFCLHTSHSQVQYGCMYIVIILKENQNKYFILTWGYIQIIFALFPVLTPQLRMFNKFSCYHQFF